MTDEVSDDPPEVDVTDSEASTSEADPASRRAHIPWQTVALVILATTAVTTSVIAANVAADRRRADADRAAVAATSGRLATALSTYDYRSFESTKKRVLSLSTGSFAGEYEKAVGALASLIAETKATSEATVSDVFVSDIADGKATSIVVVEIRGTGISGPRVSIDNYVELSLVKVEGTWKVDGVSNLNLGVASAPAAGASTSTSGRGPGPTATTVG